MLHLLDIFLTVFHTAFVLFVLFGWIRPSWRKVHLFAILLTLTAWLLIGLYKGVIGYCPLTDWHWDVKRALGERGMPSSFIEYMLERITGLNLPKKPVDIATALGMVTASLTAFYFNFFKKSRPESTPA